MNKRTTRMFTAVALATTLATTACTNNTTNPNNEGSYSPGKNITMVVPFSAGGGSDQSGRAIAAGLEAVTGQTITVENITGGSGAVGYGDLLASHGKVNKLLASETALMALPLIQDVPFNYTMFTPIMKLGDDYTLIVVQKNSPWNTCADVVAAAKAGRVIAAVSGATSLDEIVFSLMEADQKVKFDRLPYESGGEVLAGLLGGHVQVASLNPSEVIGQLQSADLKALCALAPERYTYPALKDIPTGKEQGINVAFAQWRGFIAPGGIPQEAVNFWIEAGKKFAETDAFKNYIQENFMQAAPLYGPEFVTYLDKYNADLKIGLNVK